MCADDQDGPGSRHRLAEGLPAVGVPIGLEGVHRVAVADEAAGMRTPGALAGSAFHNRRLSPMRGVVAPLRTERCLLPGTGSSSLAAGALPRYCGSGGSRSLVSARLLQLLRNAALSLLAHVLDLTEDPLNRADPPVFSPGWELQLDAGSGRPRSSTWPCKEGAISDEGPLYLTHLGGKLVIFPGEHQPHPGEFLDAGKRSAERPCLPAKTRRRL